MSKSVCNIMLATGPAGVAWRKGAHGGQHGNCVKAAPSGHWACRAAYPAGAPTICTTNATLICDTVSR